MKQNKKQSFWSLSMASKSIVTILIFSLVFSSCTTDDDEEIMEPLEMGSTAPAFTLKSLDGTNVSLSGYSNKVVVLFFFGNNCPSCKAAAPIVESMLAEPFASSTDYMLLGLDQWDGNAASVQAFKSATNVTFPLLLNASGVAADYKTTFDRIVVIDKSGKIVFSGKQSAATDIAAAKAKVMELVNPVTPVALAPGFTLKSLEGTDVSLSSYKNKVVTLFFFGNNCPSCKAVAPSVQSTLVTPLHQIPMIQCWVSTSGMAMQHRCRPLKLQPM
ncbi:MAG TPA: redoxin domain-containing protein [Draconibacterium sp.]|nr:redoxin domain-containing protein [Draconibacterium sp.]